MAGHVGNDDFEGPDCSYPIRLLSRPPCPGVTGDDPGEDAGWDGDRPVPDFLFVKVAHRQVGGGRQECCVETRCWEGQTRDFDDTGQVQSFAGTAGPGPVSGCPPRGWFIQTPVTS